MRMLAAFTLALMLSAAVMAQQPQRPASQTRTPAPAPRAEARREAAVPFAVGETLTYDVSWSNFLTAGTAVTRVTEKKASFDSTAYGLTAEGRPMPLIARIYPVYYKMDSLLDSFTSLSQWTALYTEENTRKRQTSMRFDRAARRAYYEMTAQPPVKANFTVPANVQDGLATLYALRLHDFKSGEHFTIPIADDGSMYTAEFTVTGPERVSVRFGQVDAWNLRVALIDAQQQPLGKNIGVWISTDARRLPVKIQAELPVGSFMLALREAH
jgi:hypothetical protein